jgi:hypothetical protein
MKGLQLLRTSGNSEWFVEQGRLAISRLDRRRTHCVTVPLEPLHMPPTTRFGTAVALQF